MWEILRRNSSPQIICLNSLGFSLIEIMLAMMLALLIAMVCSKLIITAKTQARWIRVVNELYEDAAFLTSLLRQEIELSGYSTTEIIKNPLVVFPSDEMKVSFEVTYEENSASDHDCLGKKTKLITNHYEMNKKNLNEVRCNGHVILDGVENMLMQLGVDTNEDGYVDAYISANKINDEDVVLAVQFDFIIKSSEKLGLLSSYQFKRINQSLSAYAVDGFHREQFVVTVPLVNK